MATKPKPMIHCKLCGWEPDTTLTRGGQYVQLKEHWRRFEFNNRFAWYQEDADEEELMFQAQTGTSIICQLWQDLDALVNEAVEFMEDDKAWEQEAEERFGSGVWESTSPADLSVQHDRLLRRLTRTEKVKTGRGIAVALYYMSKPYFDSADEVVAHAMDRHHSRVKGATFFTPGTGGGFEADQKWLGAKRGAGHPGRADKPASRNQESVAPPADEAQSSGATRVAQNRESVIAALDAGFDTDTLAGTYGVSAGELLAAVGR